MSGYDDILGPDEDFGFSSHYAYGPGLAASEVDHLIVRPHTTWRGQRGVRAAFGAGPDDDGVDDEVAVLEEEVESFGIFEDDDEDYGLYLSSGFMEPAGPSDPGALMPKSGHSGLRGGRDRFRSIAGPEAELKGSYAWRDRPEAMGDEGYGMSDAELGPFKLRDIPDWGALALGFGFLAVLWRAATGGNG